MWFIYHDFDFHILRQSTDAWSESELTIATTQFSHHAQLRGTTLTKQKCLIPIDQRHSMRLENPRTSCWNGGFKFQQDPYYQANCLVRHDYCVGCLLHASYQYRLCFVPLLTRSIPGAAGISAGGILGQNLHGSCMAACQRVSECWNKNRLHFSEGKKMKKGCTKIQLLQYCNAFPAITSPGVLVGVDMITVGLHLSFSILLISTTGVPKLPCSFCQVEECFQID